MAMNKLIIILFFLLLLGCNYTNNSTIRIETLQKDSLKGDSIEAKVLRDSATIEQAEEEMMMTYFVVIADTGNDYYALRRKMFAISNAIKLPIDTMNRYYNQSKKEIVLAETDEDEMYRGEYFPRRSASDFLSLEYLDIYYKPANTKTMALVAGVFEDEKSAFELSQLLKKKIKSTFITKASLYQGCMH
jgi:hypothetical protein